MTAIHAGAVLAIEDLAGVDRALEAHAALTARITARKAAHDAEVSRLKARLDQDLAPLVTEQKALEKGSADYLKANRRFLIRNHGKVIELEHGTIAYRIIADALKIPRNVADAVAYLRRRRNGTRYLSEPVYKLDAKAILKADYRLRRELAPFGIGVKKRENLTFKPHGYDEPVTLHERPISKRPSKKTA